MKKVLLTGCAGFIGANFVKSVTTRVEIKNEYEFHILDALTYAGRYETIQKDVEQNDHLSFFKIDIRDAVAVQKLFDQHDYDGIIHFAAESHVDNSIKNPNIFVETNVLGTLNLLNSSLKQHKKKPFRFVHVSTDEVYGTLTEVEPAFKEDHKIQPNSPYSASKASSDLLVRAYHETYGMNTSITRCSNNYGPFQFPEKLIPVMISKARADQALPVYGDGRNIRDWIYVEDHNEGVLLTYTKGRSGAVYNLGGEAEKRNLEVVKTILNILGKPETLISFVQDRLGHDWRYAMDITLARKELGFTPKVSFEEGIKRTVHWYVENQAWLDMIKTTQI